MRRNGSLFPQLPTSFLDILLGLIIVFATVGVLAWLYINPIADNGNIVKKAEFLISLEWEKGPIDIDTWVLLPSGKTIYYRSKETDLVNLERDDTGFNNDFMVINDKSVMDMVNAEYITFRAIVPGEYVVNLHVYGGAIFLGKEAIDKYNLTEENNPGIRLKQLPMQGLFDDPIKFSLKFEKLNPKVQLIFSTSGKLDHYRQELHIFRFTITPEGTVINLRTDEPIKIINDVEGTPNGR